jgi:hypothetical protein
MGRDRSPITGSMIPPREQQDGMTGTLFPCWHDYPFSFATTCFCITYEFSYLSARCYGAREKIELEYTTGRAERALRAFGPSLSCLAFAGSGEGTYLFERSGGLVMIECVRGLCFVSMRSERLMGGSGFVNYPSIYLCVYASTTNTFFPYMNIHSSVHTTSVPSAGAR